MTSALRISFVILFVWLSLNISFALYWGSTAAEIIELNQNFIVIPDMPASCKRWDSFVLARRIETDRAEYRCGPGAGYIRLWPFTESWFGPWPKQTAGKQTSGDRQ